MKNQKGFIQVILILVLVALAISGVYYFGAIKNSQNSPQIVITPTPTANSNTDNLYSICLKTVDYTVHCQGYNKFKPLYDEFLKLSLITDQFKKENLNELRFEIIKSYKNDVVYTDIGLWSGSGHAVWLHKDNGFWKEIYSGQEEPRCDLLEGLKVESGVSCYDPSYSTPPHRETK